MSFGFSAFYGKINIGDRMIAYIKGTVEMINQDSIVVEAAGIGYEINFAKPEMLSLSMPVQIHTYQHLREDENSLYGFLSRPEKELFIKLISVKGLGPKTALGIFRKASYDALITAIEQQDIAFIKSMPGIGAKTASQIILDLKGKLVSSVPDASAGSSREMEDALDALKALGYKQNECTQVLKYLTGFPDKTTDEYVKLGLQYLLSFKR